jgi:hypothetical protein
MSDLGRLGGETDAKEDDLESRGGRTRKKVSRLTERQYI